MRRLEKVAEDLWEELLQIHEWQHDFPNITETQEEEYKKVRLTLYNFLGTELKIPSGELQKIEIIRTHRMRVKGKYTRPIVAKANESGKKNFKGNHFSVMNQLPQELAEGRRHLVPEYSTNRIAKTSSSLVKNCY